MPSCPLLCLVHGTLCHLPLASCFCTATSWGRPAWLEVGSGAGTPASARHPDTAGAAAISVEATTSTAVRRWPLSMPPRSGRRWLTRLRCASGVPGLAAVRHEELYPRRMSTKAGRAASPLGVLCRAGVDETVAHAMCVCDAYARTAAVAWASIELAARPAAPRARREQ